MSGILDDLLAPGVNAYHPVEKAAGMDLAIVKQRFGGRLCPIGNINDKTTMVSGTPDGQIEFCRKIAQLSAR